ncbi:methylmalonyl-CoA epimerase, mitochondrial [Exaiptasia diaphana]|uniref:Methylmalonyl-CoA epimerase, mitochondrial n=1 Tax=Exaiptasia diaphana TaxID=2652724 RepID=A0A913XID0_EXADI|nr:methylmalonyl-CoA epimerase, mitochondrial [Exaiptasia diaphana]XP_020904881.1 methylmalonyl-CoA epimerase, mitochondrial [Exaiptasia diaphana]KXJ25944.1 Methylmalonyl-CoA epimerase, mitochondrial [Exaiptasia diaphana]
MAARMLSIFSRNFAGFPRGLSRNNLNIVRAFSTTDNVQNEKLWKIGKLNHVAIAVPDLDKATNLYKNVFGAQVSESHPLPEHGVYTVFVELGNTKIELLHPLGEKSPIAGFLNKNKSGGIHHVCIEVKNIYEAVKDLKANNIRALDPEPKIGAHGKPVVFLHPKDCGGVLVELEEE